MNILKFKVINYVFILAFLLDTVANESNCNVQTLQLNTEPN